MTSTRRVAHLASEFVAPSQPWIYDLVQLAGPFTPSVICEERLGEAEYPFADVRAVLPLARRWGWERLTRQVSTLGVDVLAPRNRWRRAIARHAMDADVFHAHFGPSGWMAVEAGLTPVVTSFYGYDATVDKVVNHWRKPYRELFARGSSFIVEGPMMGRRLEALGAPADRVRILPLIADIEALPWRPPRETGEIHVAMAGRLVEKKGFALGVAAFAAVPSLSNARLTVMGDGPEAGALRSAVDRLGLAERVQFMPFGSRAAYRDLLASSDILLQPSVTASNGDCEGGAPTVLLDAQAIGTVVVASDHADIPFVTDPAAAYLAGEADLDALVVALASAVESRGEWRDRSLAGRRHVEAQHSPDVIARRRDDIYAEAADQVRR